MTLFHELLTASAQAHGDRIAVSFEDTELGFEELLARAETLAANLVEQGVGPDDHVAIVMDNSPECVVAWLASSLLGCTEVPINPQYRGELLHHLLCDSAVTALVCDHGYLAGTLEVAGRLPSLKRILVNGGGDMPSGMATPVGRMNFAAANKSFAPLSGAPERVILYTSGTTGPSKGVVHTQRTMLTLARYNAQVMHYGPDDRLLNFFPLFHQNARYTGVVPALCSGATIRLEAKFSTSTFWPTCEREGITAFNYLGSVLRMILNVSDTDKQAGKHTITRAFGAGASLAMWTEFEQRLGIELYETYGLSEAPMATLNIPGPNRPPRGSAGRPSALFEVGIVGPGDVPLCAGEVGEIVLRPRCPDVFMAGYYNQEAATVEALRNLWFHSGDRGSLCAEGDLFFEERAKDSIRRRGENISAWEVETVLERHPAISEAAVYGIACEDSDEEVAASIVASSPNLKPAEIFAFAAELLPRHAVPTLIRIVPDLPRTSTAKVRKEELRVVAREEYAVPASHAGRASHADEGTTSSVQKRNVG